MTPRRVVLVCTGNVCRSPMAEYLLRARLPARTPWEVGSAGLSAGAGMPASPSAVAVMHEVDINMEGHRSRFLDAPLAREANVIVVMTATHREQILGLYPDAAQKTFLLKSFSPDRHAGDVHDPIGGSLETYRAIRDEISDCLPGLIAFLDCLEVK